MVGGQWPVVDFVDAEKAGGSESYDFRASCGLTQGAKLPESVEGALHVVRERRLEREFTAVGRVADR